MFKQDMKYRAADVRYWVWLRAAKIVMFAIRATEPLYSAGGLCLNKMNAAINDMRAALDKMYELQEGP